MNRTIERPFYNEIYFAFKTLNIMSQVKNESRTPDEFLLFKPKVLQAIDCVREKRKRPGNKCHL